MGHISQSVTAITTQVEGVKKSIDVTNNKLYAVNKAKLYDVLYERAQELRNVHEVSNDLQDDEAKLSNVPSL